MGAPTSTALEAGVVLATSAAVAGALFHSTRAEWWLEPACLLLLTAAALAAEALCQRQLGRVYEGREAAASGVALGMLTLPWAAAGLVGRHMREGQASELPAMALRCCMAASALSAALMTAQCAAVAAEKDSSGRSPRASLSPRSSPALANAAAGTRRSSLELLLTPGRGKPAPSQGGASAPPANVVYALLAAVLCCSLAATAVRGGGVQGVASAVSVLASGGACALAHHVVMAHFPRTLTPGEGLVVAHGLSLLASLALLLVAPAALGGVNDGGPFSAFVAGLVAAAVAVAVALTWLLRRAFHSGGSPTSSGTPSAGGDHAAAVHHPADRRKALIAAAVVAIGAAALALRPALWCLNFALATPGRRWVLALWALLLGVSLPAMHLLARSKTVSNILVRKGYHALALALFVPALLAEPHLLGVALAVAFAALAAVEVLRLGGIPVVSPRVHAFMSSFVDARDSGLVFVSHFALLLGMAAPVWLSGALDDDVAWRPWPGALAGILILGVGDAAASAVGRRWGRTPVARGSSKTVEGTLGGAVATLAVWALLLRGAPSLRLGATWGGGRGGAVAWLAAATTLSSLLEAATAQLDNLMVPLHYFALLCLL